MQKKNHFFKKSLTVTQKTDTQKHTHTHSDRHIFFVNKKTVNKNKTLLQTQQQKKQQQKKSKKREKQKVHVCMYVLFIPSFPNNRFHLGNIRKTTLSKKERKKKEEEQEAEV